MSYGVRRGISRRRFLAGVTAWGISALSGRLFLPPPHDATADDPFDPQIYLPLVANQRSPGTPHGPSKLGLHTIRPNNAVRFVQEVHDGGAHVALMKAVDGFGYLRTVKEISPETVTVGRWSSDQSVNPANDPAAEAESVMAAHMPHWEYEGDVVDYWEVLNEPGYPTIAEYVWLAEFYKAAMEIAEAHGYRLAIFSFSVGVPRWHDWEAIVETNVFAQAQAGGHALALHEYNWPTSDMIWGEPTEDLPPYEDRGMLTGRYRYLYRDFLIPRDEVVPLLITEAGLDPVLRQPGQPTTWKERYVETMIWYDDVLRADDYVVGAAMFTIGGIGQWQDYDYEELLWPNSYGQNFRDYIISMRDK